MASTPASDSTTAEPDGDGSGPSRTKRLRWLPPALVLLGWLVSSAFTGPATGLLGEVQENDFAAFLPASAESTQVIDIQEGFSDQETIPGIIVWESDEPVTDANLATVNDQISEIAQVEGVAGPASPPTVSEDQLAIVSFVPLSDSLDSEEIDAAVTEIRDIISGATGLTGYVTGTAGILADFAEVFADIDGLLLLVALGVVLVILLIVYRSPLLPFVVLFGSLLALSLASALVYVLAKQDILTLNGQSQGILFILVVGATTDYSLLLVARYREELRRHENKYDAMRAAYRAAIEPILASGGTVILGVMMLVFSDLNSNRSLGPVAAVGILGALMAALTYLPAALLLLGRKAYWPVHPDYGTERPAAGFWAGVARLVSRHPRRIWIITALALGGFALYATQFDASGVPQSDAFTTETNGTQGQKVLAEHFPGGSGSPIVIIGPEADAQETLGVVRGTEGVASATPVTDPPGVPGAPVAVVDGVVQIEAVTEYEPDSEEAEQLVVDLREGLDAVSEDVLVGGNTAVNLDVKLTTQRDLKVIIPLVLLVTLLVLMALLRAVAAPVLLIATVVLSFAATVGVAAFVFFTLAGMAGSDPAIQLFGFVFLVSLGIDYNIFLMTRIREESINLGTRPGILKGLAVTGGVITSAGLVLAATFGALMVLPLLFLVQIAFLVSFGVLLDTFVVRSLLVPALAYDIGPKVWWPSKLAKAEQPDHGDHELDSELAGLVAKESAGATE